MFPTFIPYILGATFNNVSPCAVDVVGDGTHPALEYGFSADHIAFRLRLNGDPRKNNNPNEIEEHRWGVEIFDANGNLRFTVEVDGKNNSYFVAIRDSNFNAIYTEPITLGTNVAVTQVAGIAACNGQPPPDDDFLLDFQMPLNKFLINEVLFDLTTEIVQFCFYTTTADRDDNINKEDPEVNDGLPKCGPFIHVPLVLTKLCPVPPVEGFFQEGDTVTITLRVSNPTTVTAANITVVDLLNVPAGVTISSLTTSPLANSVVPSPGPYVGNVNITTTWTGITVPALASTDLTITFTILNAPSQLTNITNVDAGIGALSGTDGFRCTIPVVKISLSLVKLCPTPPASGFFQVGDTVTITMRVSNASSVNATNVTVVDLLNVPAGVTISSLTTSPLATSIVPSPGPYNGNVNITTTWTGLTIPANGSLDLTITFTVLNAPLQVTNITNVDAGIGQLSGTDRFRCTTPVVNELVPPGRGVSYSELEIDN